MPSGTVAAFDADAGFGEVVADEDAMRLFFHCTQIDDGSRHIDVGAAVTFDIVAGHLGRYEATAVRPTL